MQKKKNEFSNPIIKDRIEILQDSKNTLKFRTFLEPKGGQNALHYHARIKEEFHIIEGELSVIINTKKQILRINEKQIITPFTTHKFYNDTNTTTIFDVIITEPKEMKKGLQIMYGLVEDGKTNSAGLPNNIFHTAIGLKMMDAFSPDFPLILQKLGISTFAYLGNKLGIKKALLTKYCDS